MCPIDGRECVVGPSTPGSSGCPIHSSHHHGCTIPVCLKNSGSSKSYMRLPSSFGTMSVCPCTSLARFKPSILTMATWCVLMGTVDVTFVRNSQGYPGLDYEICEGSCFVVLSSHWSVPFAKSCPRSPPCCHILGLSMPHISMLSIQIPHEVITLVLSQAPTVTSTDCYKLRLSMCIRSLGTRPPMPTVAPHSLH